MGIRDDLAAQGFFELPPTIAPELIARGRADVERAHAGGRPGIDAFTGDAMWEILDAILPIACEALASEVAVLPAFWAWHVGPGARGWRPHRDAPAQARDEDGVLAGVTIWVPLTDATPANGCMYCVPACWDLEYFNPESRNELTHPQYLRAIPAAAGAVLGWSPALLHWGGACSTGAPPRLATSFELLRVDLAGEVELTYPAGWRPTRDERAAIVAAMQTKYAHMVAP